MTYLHRKRVQIFPSQLGDWFVLYQLCKNCNPYFFREFIKELARDLKRKPKETKKTSKDSSNGELLLDLSHLNLF